MFGKPLPQSMPNSPWLSNENSYDGFASGPRVSQDFFSRRPQESNYESENAAVFGKPLPSRFRADNGSYNAHGNLGSERFHDGGLEGYGDRYHNTDRQFCDPRDGFTVMRNS